MHLDDRVIESHMSEWISAIMIFWHLDIYPV